MYDQIASNKRKSVFLIILFIIIISAIGWVLDYLFEGGAGIFIFASLLSVGTASVGYFSGDKVALTVSGARGPINKNDNPYVYRMVENLAITAGIPMPRVYIIPDSTLNAFATGRDPQHASVALTSGIIEKLENEELEGVIAHELSHIRNYDIRFMTLIIILVGTVVLLSDYMFRWGFIFGGRDNRNNSGPMMIVGLLLLVLSPIVAQLIKFAVSRKREFLADASGALLTRYPEGLASALEKIAHARPMEHPSKATAHLYISNPFGSSMKTGLSKIFATHPPIEERIKALRSM